MKTWIECALRALRLLAALSALALGTGILAALFFRAFTLTLRVLYP